MSDAYQFRLKYEGSLLDSHEMNVRDLAPALLAVGELFEEVNSIINDEKSRITVNIKATDPGSIDIALTLAQSILDQATHLFSGDGVEAVVNAEDLLKLVFGIGSTGGSGYGLLGLIRWVKGRKIKSIKKTGANVEINGLNVELDNGEAKVFSENEVKLFGAINIRRKMQAIIQVPLSKEGISKMKIGTEDNFQEITEEERNSFSIDDSGEEIIDEVEIETNLTMLNIAFQGKWRFSDGVSSFYANIEDKDFLDKVHKNQIVFANDDILQVTILRTQKIQNGELKTEQVIKKVLGHRSAAVQIKLPFEK